MNSGETKVSPAKFLNSSTSQSKTVLNVFQGQIGSPHKKLSEFDDVVLFSFLFFNLL